jgi:DNA polymerase III sliding clamp (beta) subunit (PCNA family)
MEEALYKGNSHANGGIKVLVDGVKPIEVEGNEYLICSNAMESTKIFEFKDKTNKEILDEFYKYSDCIFKQNEANSGDFIVCKKVVLDTNKRNITGTIKEIINIMQSEKGCNQSTDNVFKTGGEVETTKNIDDITIKYKGYIPYVASSYSHKFGKIATLLRDYSEETIINSNGKTDFKEPKYYSYGYLKTGTTLGTKRGWVLNLPKKGLSIEIEYHPQKFIEVNDLYWIFEGRTFAFPEDAIIETKKLTEKLRTKYKFTDTSYVYGLGKNNYISFDGNNAAKEMFYDISLKKSTTYYVIYFGDSNDGLYEMGLITHCLPNAYLYARQYDNQQAELLTIENGKVINSDDIYPYSEITDLQQIANIWLDKYLGLNIKSLKNNLNVSKEETLKGGVGDYLSIEYIAKKHNVSLEYANEQLQKGIEIESEHTNDLEKQTEIAKDHLSEFIDYYQELEKMENKLKSKEMAKESVNDNEINSQIVNNWEQVPTIWKNTNEIKEVNFINNPFNKDLIKILTTFAGTDALRPIFSGVHFDENGITVTDAHKLISLPYPNKDYMGTYATLNPKTIKESNVEIKNDIFTDVKYPNYAAVIPEAKNAKRVQKISVYKLLQYTKVALHYTNQATHQVKYSLGDTSIGLNGSFLIEILETALKLGHKELYAYTINPNNAIVFSPSKNYTLGKDVILLMMPVILHSSTDDIIYNGAEDLDWMREITVYFDFDKNEIINKNGSVADFKMNYGEYDVLDSNEIKMLKNYAKNTLIPILDYFRVQNNKISAFDLNTYLTIYNTNLKDGLYKIVDNAVEYDASMSLSSLDEYPNSMEEKSEEQIKFIIDSDVLTHYTKIALDYVSTDDLRPLMTGICFDYKDKEMFMVSTDAHKLFKINLTKYIEINKDQKDFQFVISKINLLKFLDNIDNSPLIITSTVNNVTFENDKIKFQSKLIDGKYPNYNAVISQYKTKKLEINIKDLFNCIKSKEAENFIKSNKKEDITIYNKIGKNSNEFDIFLATTKYNRQLQKLEILSEIEICKVNYKLSEGDYQTKDNLILLMPKMFEKSESFSFDVKYFKIVLESLNCENVEMFYDEKNRAYIFGGDCFAYKNTIKAQKSISKTKEIIAKVETKKVESKASKEKSKGVEAKFKLGDNVLINYGEEVGKTGIINKVYSYADYPKSIKIDDTPYYEIEGASKNIPQDNLELNVATESNEIEKAIETFEMLVNLGGTDVELKEWNEAVETFKMLIGDDANIKKEIKSNLSFEDWLKENNIDVYKHTYYWVADDGKGDYRQVGTKAQVMKALKDEWKNKYSLGGNYKNSFYALTSDGMRNKKRVKILKVAYWKGKETNHVATLDNIKEFLAQVPKDEKIVIYADDDYIDDKTSFYGQLHSAYTPLYTSGAVTVDAILDENNDIIWNKYEGSKYVVNVDDYKMAKGGYTRIPYDLKISGIYDFKSNLGIGYELSIYGTERQSDTEDALNMLDSNIKAKKELGSIIVKNNAIKRLAKGETVNAISSTGVKGKLTRIKDLYKSGGDLKIVESDNWQIKNANDRYYSVSMQSGNPIWNESPDLGYSYKKEDAENIKNKLIELGNKDLELVQYNPNWWKMELGGNVLSNNEIIKNIDFSDNTDEKHGRYDFSFETEDSKGASMFDYDGYIIEAPSSSRMNDEIEWGQNVPEDWEKAEKILIDAFYDWKKNKMKNGGMDKGGKIEDEQNKLKLEILKLTSKSFKMMANSPIQKRTISQIETLREKLKNLGGKFENGGNINDLTY